MRYDNDSPTSAKSGFDFEDSEILEIEEIIEDKKPTGNFEPELINMFGSLKEQFNPSTFQAPVLKKENSNLKVDPVEKSPEQPQNEISNPKVSEETHDDDWYSFDDEEPSSEKSESPKPISEIKKPEEGNFPEHSQKIEIYGCSGKYESKPSNQISGAPDKQSKNKKNKANNRKVKGETSFPLQASHYPEFPALEKRNSLILSAPEMVVKVPSGAPENILKTLSEEALSGAPLDYYNTKGKMVPFYDPQKKSGKFSLKAECEMLCYFLGVINQKEIDTFDEDGWYEISTREFDHITHRYPAYLNWLERHGYIEWDHSYSDGNIEAIPERYCMKYRFPDSVIDLEEFRITNPKVLRKILKPKAEPRIPKQYLESCDLLKAKVSSIQLLPGAYEEIDRQEYVPKIAKNEKAKLDKLSNPKLIQSSFVRRDPGRLFSWFTNLPKYIRKKYLTLGGEPIEELDIRCAQPSILYSIYAGWNIDEADLELFRSSETVEGLKEKQAKELRKFHYLLTAKDVKEGIEVDFYNFLILEQAKIDGNVDVFRFGSDEERKRLRSEMKEKVFEIFFCKDKIRRHLPLADVFKKHFPLLLTLIKKHSMSGEELWRVLQGRESEIVIDGICMELAGLDFDFFSVHDSICFPASKREIVLEVWKRHLDLAALPHNL